MTVESDDTGERNGPDHAPGRLGLALGAVGAVGLVGLLAWAINLNGSDDPAATTAMSLAPSSHSTLESASPSTVANTTSVVSEVALPILIPGGTTPRAVADEFSRSPDWRFLDPGPLAARNPAVTAWTGEEIVIWGTSTLGASATLDDGAAFNPSSGVWRVLPPAPLTLQGEFESAWTGDELIIWGNRVAAAWNPDGNEWRLISPWPLTGGFYQEAVWTGEEIIDLGAGVRVDPLTGSSQPIAAGPRLTPGGRASVVWAGGKVVIVTGEGAYDPATDTWVAMPGDGGLSRNATAATVVGDDVVAVDYEMSASLYSPHLNSWTGLAGLPLGFGECFPTVVTVQDTAIAESCGGWAIYRSDLPGWIPGSYPTVVLWYPAAEKWHLIAAGDDLYAWGQDGLAVLDNPDLLDHGTPGRLIIGAALLDLDLGWTITSISATKPVQTGRDIVVILAPSNETICRITVVEGDAEQQIRDRFLPGFTGITEIQPLAGGSPYQALETSIEADDEMYRFTWALDPGNVVDVGCTDVLLARSLAERIWTPWE